MGDEPLFLSSHITGMLAYLEGKEPQGGRSYPPVATKPTVKMPEGESVHQWLTRCVAEFKRHGWPLETWVAAPDLAIIALVEWDQPGHALKACSIQVIKTEGTLADYLADAGQAPYYVRLDWDYETLAPMFTHPLPHVHAWKSDAAPRFVSEGDGGNVVVDFLEWVCRHFYHEDWLLWAEDVCAPEFDKKFGKDTNPLDYIFRAFKESAITILREYSNEIQDIKRLLREKKDRAYGLRASMSDRQILQYP